jgi:hypothetical protein
MSAEAVGGIYRRLCELANVDPLARPVGGKHATEFVYVLTALQQIGNAKVDSYGDGRMLVESADYDTKMLYSDLHRKHIRVNQLMESIKQSIWTPGHPVPVDALMETFSDLAVYAVRGIQILRRLEEKGMIS